MRARRWNSSNSLGFGAIVALALLHVAVLALLRSSDLASNCIQLASAFLAFGLCLNRARRCRDAFFRYMWLQLGMAFAIWCTAQCFFLFFLVRMHRMPHFPSVADVLWLLFAFPILMVTVTRKTGAKWEWVNWLDSAQAGLFFFVLDALVFSHSHLLSSAMANDVQAIALVMAGALRYSTASQRAERTFFRNVAIYLVASGVLTALPLQLAVPGANARWLDLCWSAPFLLFCSLVLASERSASRSAKAKPKPTRLPKHLQGVSALGLAVMSILVGGALESQHPLAGLAVLAVSFVLFAVRTSARELQLHAAHDILQHSTLHDALTGLANRTLLRRELAERLKADSAPESSVALLFIDLDRFKTINDGLGPAFGDQLLIAVAGVLGSVVRPGDLLARLGGDEFVLLAAGVDRAQAQALASSLVARLRQPIHLQERVLHMTASVGVVLGERGAEPDTLLRDADCAMYVAKHRGKNQVRVFEVSMGDKANDELWLETDLRDAIDSGAISAFYQPIYSLSKQAVVGFEALARWQHPTRGMISPAAFIPVAEDTGLILMLGQQVLGEACRQIAQWNALYHRDFTVSVNVSARQFADEGLLEAIRGVLDESALPPNRLKLEITESVLLSGVQSVEEVLNRARAMGIEISLDDFGTGYSSLSYLLRFPFDVIKIDRSFVQSLDHDSQRAYLTGTIVQLANNLGKKVIAEGVETTGERECLQAMDCDLLQGYLYSKPLPAAAVEQLLSQHRNVASSGGDHVWPIWAFPKSAPVPGESAGITRPPLWDPPVQPAYMSPN